MRNVVEYRWEPELNKDKWNILDRSKKKCSVNQKQPI